MFEIYNSMAQNKETFTYSKNKGVEYNWIKQGNKKFIEKGYYLYKQCETEMANELSDLRVQLSNE